MPAWLGVVSAEHVARGVSLGVAQINHGKRAGLARMHAGDWLIYYSPQQRLGEHDPVKAFTAIGSLPDAEIWQADEGCFKPWRRRVDYIREARHVPIDGLRDRLDLTASPNWGYQLRRGLLSLSDRDLAAIHQAMIGTVQAAVRSRTAGPDAAVRSGQPDPQAAATLW
jgi:hypothetical protein